MLNNVIYFTLPYFRELEEKRDEKVKTVLNISLKNMKISKNVNNFFFAIFMRSKMDIIFL